MTDWTPETNRIQTMHLTADELAALKAAKWGWVASHEFRPDDWRDVESPNWTSVRIYRAKPAPVTQDVVPWEAIDKRWKWCARDKSGGFMLYEAKPYISGANSSMWLSEKDQTGVSRIFAGYTPGTCDWRDSMQQRPVTVGAVTEPPLLLRAYEVVHHDYGCPAIRGNGDKDCKCDAVPFLNDLRKALTESDAVAAAKTMCAKGGV